MDYPWFDIIESSESIAQGDIIDKCSILNPSPNHYEAIKNRTKESDPVQVIEVDVIVMSQTCDIINDKVNSLIICPLWPLSELVKNNGYYKSSTGREHLRQGKEPSYHLLNKFDIFSFENDFHFVDFHHIYSVPKSYLSAIAKDRPKRLRLLPPYREHLSQAFARYFMRVGLPLDIDSDEIKKYKC